MAFKKIGKALKRVAPYAASIAGTAIGGPVGGQIVKALGLSPDASDEDVERVLAANDPTQIAALRKIEADAKAAILQSETDRLRIDADDRGLGSQAGNSDQGQNPSGSRLQRHRRLRRPSRYVGLQGRPGAFREDRSGHGRQSGYSNHADC